MSRLRRTSLSVALFPYLLFMLASAGLHNHGMPAGGAAHDSARVAHLAGDAPPALTKPADSAQTCPACEWLLHSAICDVAGASALGAAEAAVSASPGRPATPAALAACFHSRAPPA